MRNRMNRFDFAPTLEDLTHAFGLGPRRSVAAELAPAIGILAGGFVLGAVAALLFAPRSGPELRSAIGERVGDLRRRAQGAEGEGEGIVLKEL